MYGLLISIGINELINQVWKKNISGNPFGKHFSGNSSGNLSGKPFRKPFPGARVGVGILKGVCGFLIQKVDCPKILRFHARQI